MEATKEMIAEAKERKKERKGKEAEGNVFRVSCLPGSHGIGLSLSAFVHCLFISRRNPIFSLPRFGEQSRSLSLSLSLARERKKDREASRRLFRSYSNANLGSVASRLWKMHPKQGTRNLALSPVSYPLRTRTLWVLVTLVVEKFRESARKRKKQITQCC
jgi:hypothetical protein